MKKRILLCSAAALAMSGGAWAQDVEGEAQASDPCEINPAECEILLLPSRRLPAITVDGLRDTYEGGQIGAVTRLEADELAIRSSPNPADQLRAVPGVAISRSGGPGALTQIRTRGSEGNHTLVLYNGTEISDPITGETDFGILTGLGVSSLEVLRGGASALYGSDAIGGVVSLNTDDATGFTGLAEIGTLETARANLNWGSDSYPIRFGGGLSGYTTGGVDTSGLGGEEDGSSALSGTVHAGYEFDSNWDISAFAVARRSDAETDPDANFDGLLENGDRTTEAEQYIIGAALEGETDLGNRLLDHDFRASFNEVTRDNFADGALSDTATGQRTKVSYSPSIQIDDYSEHRISAILDYEQEDYDRRDVQFGGFTDASESLETLGFGAEYRMDLDTFDLSISARHDDNDGRFDDATTWRVGAGYDAFDDYGRLRASIGTGVKNPTFTELFGFFPGSFVGNPDLVPEESLTWDIGYAHGFDNGLGLSATYFNANLEDEIFTAFNPDFTSTARNRDGESERQGIELAGDYTGIDDWTFKGQATFTESENETGEDEIRVPGVTASLSAYYSGYEDLTVGAALDYVGEQDDFNFGAFPAERVTLDGYTLLSASLEYPLSERTALTLRGENLLDQDAIDVFGFNTPGAAVFVGLKLKEW